MTSNNTMLLDQIEPDAMDRVSASRRDVFTRHWKTAAVWASAPLVLALASREAFGQGLPSSVKDVLNFALTLEYIEDEFYRTANRSRGLIPSRFRSVFRLIGQHETAHVELLQGVLGADAVAKPGLDFTAGGTYPDVFENFETFRAVSETFEDLGVAAYKGQAPRLAGTGGILTTALQIHSVEARHAAEVRRIGNKIGWDGAFDRPMSKNQVLAAATPFLA